MHDRDIETRCDDSVARVIAGSPVILRRSRGYVPRGVKVTPPFEVPVLACGGMLKNAVCVGLGDSAYFGPHIGRSEEHTSELQSQSNLVCRLLLEKKKKNMHGVVDGAYAD